MSHNVQRSYLDPRREEQLELPRQQGKSREQVLEEYQIRGRAMKLLADDKISRTAIRVFNYILAVISVEDAPTIIRPSDIAVNTTMSITAATVALYELEKASLVQLVGVRVKVNAVHTRS